MDPKKVIAAGVIVWIFSLLGMELSRQMPPEQVKCFVDNQLQRVLGK